MKNKPSFLLIALLIIPFFTAAVIFAMPPHPALLEKIRRGEIAEPDFFKNAGQLRQKGIDASWTAPGLILKRLSASSKTATRSFGPLFVPSGADTQNGLRTGYTFEPVIADRTIAAAFASIPTHTITVSAGLNGTIIPLGPVTVDEGDTPPLYNYAGFRVLFSQPAVGRHAGRYGKWDPRQLHL